MQHHANGRLPSCEDTDEYPSGRHGYVIQYFKVVKYQSVDEIDQCRRDDESGIRFASHYVLDFPAISPEHESESADKDAQHDGECFNRHVAWQIDCDIRHVLHEPHCPQKRSRTRLCDASNRVAPSTEFHWDSYKAHDPCKNQPEHKCTTGTDNE